MLRSERSKVKRNDRYFDLLYVPIRLQVQCFYNVSITVIYFVPVAHYCKIFQFRDLDPAYRGQVFLL